MKRLLSGRSLAHSVLIMRHAERPDITHPSQAENTLLTAKGIENAQHLGSALLSISPPQHIFHSTVPRCQQTAEALLVGLEKQGFTPKNHGPCRELASPYLPNPQQTYGYSFSLGLDSLAFIQLWFEGKVDRSLANDAYQAAQQQLAFLWAKWQKNPGFHLHVSHDWNILLLTWAFLNIPPSKESWPQFLEGLMITFEAQNILFQFRDLQQRKNSSLITP